MTSSTVEGKGLRVILGAVSMSACAAIAADVTVTDSASLKLDDGDRLVPAPITVSATLPDIGVQPILWVDASDTTGWVFGGNGKPSKIPSKVGSRYLKNYSEAGDHLNFSIYPYGASLVTAGLNGKAYLDFGQESGGNGYVLNPVEQDGGGTANRLDGIGTVIAVYGSQNGGGYFVFGGGSGASAGAGTRDGDVWNRGTDSQQEGSSYRYSVPLFGAQALSPLYYATAYFDGCRANANGLGFNGGWQVVTVKASAATASAYGIGLNATPLDNNGYNRRAGGGMRIAEVVVYGELLTDDQRTAVEAYLQKKWLGRRMRGTDGLSHAGRVHLFSTSVANAGVAASAEVPAGETLEIEEVVGGRGTACSFTKSGAGTLALGTSGNFHGTLKLGGGTLKMTSLGDATEMPAPESVLLHLDTTGDVADNFVTAEREGVTYVQCWKNLATNRKSAGKAFYAGQTEESHQPVLTMDGRTGVKIVDFGRCVTGGAFLNISTETAEYSNTAMPIVGSAFFVLSSEFGGVLLSGGNDSGVFARGACGAISGNTAASPVWSSGYPTSLNGVPIDSAHEGQGTLGLHLLATQLRGTRSLGRIGANTAASTGGGMRIAEIVAYDHLLSPEEFRQAEAALMAKWFNRNRPGLMADYDIVSLSVEEASTIDIPDGVEVHVRSLVCKAPLVKTGGGALIVDATSNVPENGIARFLDLRGGSFSFAETEDVDEYFSAPAPGPILHLDPSDASTVMTDESGKLLLCRDMSSSQNGIYPGAVKPTLMADAFGTGLNGIDFGDSSAVGNYSAPSALFVNSLEGVRTLYVVVANADKQGYFLGLKTRDNANWLDDQNLLEFSRNGSGSQLMGTSDNYAMVNKAPIYCDGERIAATAEVDGDSHLLEFHANGNGYASAIGRNAIGHYMGGIRIGEMIAYDRVLTDREKAATRNYLQRKWFGREDFDPLPEKAEESTEIFFEELTATDGGVFGEVKAGNLVGGGNVSKVEDGTMEIRDLTEFNGSLTVTEGTLKLTGAPPPVEPKLPAYVPAVHLDASRTDTLTLETDGNGIERVLEWRSLTGDGLKAVPRSTSVSSAKPQYVADGELGNRSAVRFGNYYPGMSFRDAGNTAIQTISQIRTVLWIFGSQEGGGFLLGSGDTAVNNKDNFHRGASGYGSNASDPIFFSSAADGCRCAEMVLNDGERMSSHAGSFPPVTEATPLTTGFSGGWDFVSMRVPEGFVNTVTADGLAYCFNANAYRDGRQRLAEVVIYTNRLTAAECREAGYRLRLKWGLIAGMQRALTNDAEVIVASGASLDLGGTNQFLKAIGGAGEVSNGNLETAKLVADLAEEPLSISGTFTAAEPFEVEIRNTAGRTEGEYELLSATAIENAEAIQSAAITGAGVPAGRRLRIAGGKVYLRLGAQGSMILFR